MDNLNNRIDDRLSFKRARHRQKKTIQGSYAGDFSGRSIKG